MKKSKKNATVPNSTVVQNCTFHTTPELDSVAIAKANAVKAIAEALGKAADAMRGSSTEATGLKISGL